MKGCRHTNAFPCVSLLCLAAPESRSRERSLNNLSPYRPRNQEAGRGGTVRRVHTLRCRRSRAAVPLRRESSRSRGNVREPPNITKRADRASWGISRPAASGPERLQDWLRELGRLRSRLDRLELLEGKHPSDGL